MVSSSGGWCTAVVLTVLLGRAAGETLWHGRVAVGVGEDGDAQELHRSTEQGRQKSVIRRELDTELGDIEDVQVSQPVDQLFETKASTRTDHHVVRKRRSATSTRYSLWHNVSGYENKLCMHTGQEKYEKHVGDEEAATLSRCMDHCESNTWCSTLSFHGNQHAMTEHNVCIIVGWPCIATTGEAADISYATDNNWLTMNYSDWPQVADMTGKHCDGGGQGVQHELKQNIPSLEDCMDQCLPLAWCTTVSYERSSNACNLVSHCDASADAAHSDGSDVFSKGSALTPDDPNSWEPAT